MDMSGYYGAYNMTTSEQMNEWMNAAALIHIAIMYSFVSAAGKMVNAL